MPYCQRPPITHTMEGVNRPNLRGGGAPSSITVKNKSKLCKHVPLLLFRFHAYGLFTNWKIQTILFLWCFFFFFILPPSPSPTKCLCPQSAIQHSATRGSPYILQMWPGQLKLRWKHFHTNGKPKMKKKMKKEKFHKQKQENKIRGDFTIWAKSVFLLSEDSKLLLTILCYTFISLLSL